MVVFIRGQVFVQGIKKIEAVDLLFLCYTDTPILSKCSKRKCIYQKKTSVRLTFPIKGLIKTFIYKIIFCYNKLIKV